MNKLAVQIVQVVVAAIMIGWLTWVSVTLMQVKTDVAIIKVMLKVPGFVVQKDP